MSNSEMIELTDGLIQAFVIKEKYWKALGVKARAAGIRECITHLQEFRQGLDSIDLEQLRELREYYDAGNSVRGEDGTWETDVSEVKDDHRTGG